MCFSPTSSMRSQVTLFASSSRPETDSCVVYSWVSFVWDCGCVQPGIVNTPLDLSRSCTSIAVQRSNGTVFLGIWFGCLGAKARKSTNVYSQRSQPRLPASVYAGDGALHLYAERQGALSGHKLRRHYWAVHSRFGGARRFGGLSVVFPLQAFPLVISVGITTLLCAPSGRGERGLGGFD